MIARVWTGQTRSEDVDAYLAYANETGLAELRRTPGNRGAWLLHRLQGPVAEFQVISFWESRGTIRGFAGDDPEKAVYYPEDERYLLEMNPSVAHFEIFDPAGAGDE